MILFSLFALLASAFSANAQIADKELVAKGINIYSGNVKMSKADLSVLNGFDMKSYNSGKGMFGAGVTFVSLGAIPAAISAWAMVETITYEPVDDIP